MFYIEDHEKMRQLDDKSDEFIDAAAKGDAVNRRMPSSIIDDLCKSEMWSEFKKDFAEIGIHGRTVDSLALIPLLETALDDGAISPEEKRKILYSMKNIGLLTIGIDPKLNALWLPFIGRTEFLIVWTVYLRDVSGRMLSPEKAALKALIIESWEFMALTIGGYLKIHDLDERMMLAIESAFYCGEEEEPASDAGYHCKGEYCGNKNQDLTRWQVDCL